MVHPAHRRRGIGRSLVWAVLEPYAGIRQKVLLTDDLPGLAAFYQSMGFAETRDFRDGSLRAFVRYDS